MSLEGYSAKKEHEPALDAELFARFQESKIDVLPKVRPDEESLAAQRQQFLAGSIPCPHFTYEKLKDADFAEKEAALRTLKAELRARTDQPEALVRTYCWAINERIAKLRMLAETKRMAEGGDPQYHMRRFRRYSEFIYGKSEPEIFSSVMGVLGTKLHAEATDLPSDKQVAYDRLSELVARASDTGTAPMQSEDPGFPAPIDAEGAAITDARQLKGYFDEALRTIGLDGEWKVVIDRKTRRNTIAVRPYAKKVLLPNSAQLQHRSRERQLTPEMIRGLIVHEIGTHALRSYNGARSRVHLLSVGLDRYEVGEEGLATYREQQETGTRDYAGFDNYLAAGLAVGLDGGGARNFAEVHALLRDYYSVCDGQDDAAAKELAWDRCLRIFRGTPGDVPGAIFTKDTIYRKGNMATYTLMRTDGADTIDFNIGKFDPSNTRHIIALVELGVLDQDLEALNDR